MTDNTNTFQGAIASSVSFSPPRYLCSKHGESDAVMNIKVFDTHTNVWAKNRTVKMERNYCCSCFVEALDRIGVEDMKRAE